MALGILPGAHPTHPAPQTKGIFQKWWLWLALLCMPPLLAFALSNLCLTSPWGREWLATKIQRHCGGLPTRIGSASWSPWHGLTLRSIVITPPPGMGESLDEPLVQIASLRLKPRWRSCWHGHFEVLSADLEAPRLVVSLQMLSHLAQPGPELTTPLATAQPTGPAIAALPPSSPSPPQNTPASGTTASNEPATTPPTTPDAQPASSAQPATPDAQPVATMAAATAQPTVWIRLRHASLRVLAGVLPGASFQTTQSAKSTVLGGSAPPLIEFIDLSADLPVSGAAAASSLSLACLKVHGSPLLTDFTAPLAWQAPVLSLSPVETRLMGIHIQLAGKLGLLAGLPIQLEAQAPSQSPAQLTLSGGSDATAGHLASSCRFRGFILAPGTWQGDCLAESSAISINSGEHHAHFDNGNCCIALRGGVLSCLDARLIGDDLSLLGNATLLADGRCAGVVRLVAVPETVLGIVKRFFPHIEAPPILTPLTSPQRVACDLEAVGTLGTLGTLQLHLGHNGPLVSP